MQTSFLLGMPPTLILLFNILQGIDSLSCNKGFKYIVANRVNLYRFQKETTTSCNESTRGKMKMIEIQCDIRSLTITKHMLAARSFSKWNIAIARSMGSQGFAKS